MLKFSIYTMFHKAYYMRTLKKTAYPSNSGFLRRLALVIQFYYDVMIWAFFSLKKNFTAAFEFNRLEFFYSLPPNLVIKRFRVCFRTKLQLFRRNICHVARSLESDFDSCSHFGFYIVGYSFTDLFRVPNFCIEYVTPDTLVRLG